MFNLISFIPRAIMQGIPLLFGSTGETLTEKSGNLNLGIPGIMYVGAISGVIGAFYYEATLPSPDANNGAQAELVTLRANQNVTGLALTTFGIGIGNFFGGSLIKLAGSKVPAIILNKTSAYFSATPAPSGSTGWFSTLFLSYGFLAYTAVAIALIAAYILRRTRVGLHLRAVGENPSTADAAGIDVTRYK